MYTYIYIYVYYILLYIYYISIKQMYFGAKCVRAELFEKRGKL